MVWRFSILGAFAPQSIVVLDKGEEEEKKEGVEGENRTWIHSTKTPCVIYLTVKYLFLWVMCKLSNKRAKVVESSCGERYIHSRRCWQGRQSVFSLNLYEYWIIYFWFVCCFFFCFLDFRNTRTHFKTWTKRNASLHRWWGPTEVWGPPAWSMVSVANRWKAKGARIHTVLRQDPQDASVSVLVKFSLFFPPLVFRKFRA